MVEATKYANPIAKEENDKAMEEGRKSGKSEVLVPTAERQMAGDRRLWTKSTSRWLDRTGKRASIPVRPRRRV
ncbi:MAG: hypothetical protein IPG33_00180 [Betaproteobacteria bacterium]|nr:hypothetical protein [Betaproteobacteria bacterium]